MPTVTIVPMALPQSITVQNYNIIKNAQINGIKLFAQTKNHPSSAWLDKENIAYESMDDLYDCVCDFDELNEAIANRLICQSDVVYAVCGRGIASPLLECIKNKAIGNNTDIKITPSSGYGEAAAAVCGFDMFGACIFSANSMPEEINVKLPLCVEEIDTRICAGEVKLKLTEFYPENSEVIFAYTDESGVYHKRHIKLFELDRQAEYFATTVCLVRAYTFLELDRYGMSGVEEITRILRSPNGCPWVIKQTHESLKTALIEETYEVIDAIENGDMESMCEELGDLLLQIVFHAHIETDRSEFTMRDVCTGIVKKLIFRHPHVFANRSGIDTADDVLVAWEQLKKVEKKQETQSDAIMAVPKNFPALMRSSKVQKRARDAGFDFSDAFEAMPKIAEETQEVVEAVNEGNEAAVFEEMGDLLFAVVNVARLLKVNSELALQAATDKFQTRFCEMEKMVIADGKKLEEMTLEQMDMYWARCKNKENGKKI